MIRRQELLAHWVCIERHVAVCNHAVHLLSSCCSAGLLTKMPCIWLSCNHQRSAATAASLCCHVQIIVEPQQAAGKTCLCLQFLAWDQKSRNHVDIADFPPDYQGNQLEGHEFNHNTENQLIFEEGDIRVYTNPAFHYDTPGPVSLRLEWNGISVTYSGVLQHVRYHGGWAMVAQE